MNSLQQDILDRLAETHGRVMVDERSPDDVVLVVPSGARFRLDAVGVLRSAGSDLSVAQAPRSFLAPMRMACCSGCGAERESFADLPAFEALPYEEADGFFCDECRAVPDPDVLRDARLDR